MNLIIGAPTWLVAILFAALAAAAVEDFIRRQISNVTCLAVLVAALVAMGLHGFSLALWQNAVVFLFLLGAGYLLFAAKKMGGGDVKLFACLGLWVNISDGIRLIATVLIAGGVIALLYLASRLLPSRRPRESIKGRQIPYGLAIVAGAALIFVGQMGLLKSKPERPTAESFRSLS
ncbi:MAG TPA: prepilin peptidase [Sphingomicrobium sp.]